MKELNSKERIMRIFQNKEVDRPALKLWGATLDKKLLHPSYKSVWELACRKSDLFVPVRLPFEIYCGVNSKKMIEVNISRTEDSLWNEKHVTLHTPKGSLHSIEKISTVGEPSYMEEYWVKEPEDLEKILSVGYEPIPLIFTEYYNKLNELGERGVVLIDCEHAGYALQRLMGSEKLAYFSIDCKEELIRLVEIFSGRINDFVKEVIDGGITGPFQWVGPELFIPPLMSPLDFDDFVFSQDRRICDTIHNSNGNVWVHCHGKVEKFIPKFIEMGVDILNPLEPPKNGDIDMNKIVREFGNKIGLEGNIEIQDIIQCESNELKEKIDYCVQAGKKSGRFILCPSAGYMEYPFPEERYISNLILYLEYGLECVEGE